MDLFDQIQQIVYAAYIAAWSVSGALIGAIVVPILYYRQQRNPMNGALVGFATGAIGNVLAIAALTWITPKSPKPRFDRTELRRLLLMAETQVLFFFMGLAFMLAGSVRVIIEFESITGFDAQQLKKGLAERFTGDTFTSLPALLVAAALMLVGYGLWWGLTALGAREAPAWRAGQLGLISIIIVLLFGGAGLMLVLPGFWFLLLPMILIAVIAGWFLILFRQDDYRFDLGPKTAFTKRKMHLLRIRNGALVLSTSTLAALGIVYAVLTDAIELPLPDTQPGELLYITTFDNYNDEWDIYESTNESAQVMTAIDGDHHLVLTINPDEQADFLITTLNRKFRDFDLRVTTTQLASDDYHDNIIGVIFRYRDADNFYAFEISGDGYYRLLRREKAPTEETATDTILSLWIPTTITDDEGNRQTLIRPGRGNEITNDNDAMNEIRIIGRDDRFWFFINGQPVWFCLRGNTRQSTWNPATNSCATGNVRSYVVEDDMFKQGRIGLEVGNTVNSTVDVPISIAFDNLVVTGPPKTITVPVLEETE